MVYFFLFYFYFFLKKLENEHLCMKILWIGALHSGEQAILVNWYNSLTSKGNLSWSTVDDLCGQTGVTCDSLNPQRVTEM